MNTSKLVIGTLAGVAIGATAGILFAPEKGSTARKQIMDKGEKFKSSFDESIEALKDKFNSNNKDSEVLIDKGKPKFDV